MHKTAPKAALHETRSYAEMVRADHRPPIPTCSPTLLSALQRTRPAPHRSRRHPDTALHPRLSPGREVRPCDHGSWGDNWAKSVGHYGCCHTIGYPISAAYLILASGSDSVPRFPPLVGSGSLGLGRGSWWQWRPRRPWKRPGKFSRHDDNDKKCPLGLGTRTQKIVGSLRRVVWRERCGSSGFHGDCSFGPRPDLAG